MIRYLICTCELISVLCGVMGAEALLGRLWHWLPHPKKTSSSSLMTKSSYESESEDEDEMMQDETNVIHVPGILNIKVRKEESNNTSKGNLFLMINLLINNTFNIIIII